MPKRPYNYPKSSVSPDEYEESGRRKLRAREEKIHGRRRYASQDHEYLVSWYSDTQHDETVRRTLTALGVPFLVSRTPDRLSYKLMTRAEIHRVVLALRNALGPNFDIKGQRARGAVKGAENPFVTMLVNVKELHNDG